MALDELGSKLSLGREIQDRDVGVEIGAEQVVGEGPGEHLDRVVPLPPRDLVVKKAHRVLVATVWAIDTMGPDDRAEEDIAQWRLRRF
jgi:hypothetical protein